MMVTVNQLSHLGVTFVTGYQGHAELNFHLLDLKTEPIPIGPTGGLVNITPQLSIDLGVEGSLTSSITFGATQTTTITAGVQYANGQTTWVDNPPINTLAFDPITIDATLSADVYVKPKISAALNAGIFGWNAAEIDPYVGLKGYVEADANLAADPWWTIYGGLNIEAGADFSVLFGFKHGNFDESLDLPKWHITDSNGPYNKKISITTVLPSPLVSSATVQSLTLNGTDFLPDLRVRYCYKAVCSESTINNPGLSTASFPATINKEGTWTFQAINADQSTSSIYSVTVQPPSVQPHIVSLLPEFLQVSETATELTLNGTGLQSGLTVQLCHSVCDTSLSGSQILSVTPDGGQAVVLATLGDSGSWTAQVFNPDGGTSNTYPFTVQPEFSVNVSPGAGIVGTTAFSISVFGATPNRTVTRNSTRPDGTTQTTSLVTDSMGSFSVPPFFVSVAGPYVEKFTDDATGSNTAPIRYIVSDTSSHLITVTPGSQPFGSVAVGSTEDLTFTVTNTGSGTLSGSAGVSAPFSVVSGGTYNLTAGASQTVTVRFSPTASQSYSQSVTFTGGSGATAGVSGTGTQTAPASLSYTTKCNGSSPEIDLSFTVSGGTETVFDIYRNGSLLYPSNTGTTFNNYGSLVAGQTYSYYVIVHLTSGSTATSNTVNATAPTSCSVQPSVNLTATPTCNGSSPKIGLSFTVSGGRRLFSISTATVRCCIRATQAPPSPTQV
jgi:hypothetical protein